MKPAHIALAMTFSLLAVSCAATELYVSPGGKDTNPGTKAKPFASIGAAKGAVRKLVAAGLGSDVKVIIAPGTYYLPNGLTFGPEDSGTKKHSITYAAADADNAPVLVGGQVVTGFKKHKGNVYVAALPEGAEVKVASENGVRYALARSPNEGWLSARRGRRGSFTYYGDHLKELAGSDFSDGIASTWPNYDWFNRLYPLKSVDPQARTVTMGAGIALRKRDRFCILNVLGSLDVAGECQISKKEGKLYVWPRKTPIGKQTIAVSTADHVILIKGTEKKTVRNLHFKGLDLTMANKDVVYITSAEDCSVRACRIENAWDRGVFIHRAAQRITIAGNEIRFNGLHGIEMTGAPFGGPDINKHHVIANNHVHHCGVITGHGFGIRLVNSGHNKVLHNHVHHLPRYGISVKLLTLPFMKNPEHKKNRYKYLHARKNLVAYNHIHHVNLDSEDTGAIQSWGSGRGNVYDHNLIHDVGNPHMPLQSGIYLDDSADYSTVTNNVIYNVIGRGHTQSIYVKGIGNKIDNNVLIVGQSCGAAIRTKQSVAAYHHEYTHNVIYFENRRAAIYQFDDYKGQRVKVCDNNLYFNPGGSYRIAGRNPYGRSLGAWKRGFDKNSVTADPLFVDAAKRDYRLKPNSPALKLGIKSIDLSEVGLTAKFPKRLPRN